MNQQSPTPPKWANRFLEWFCHPNLLEEIQGDAYELFERRCKKEGVQIARRRFTWDVLRSFRLSTIKNIDPTPIMLKNNFKTAFRQLKRQKFYSAINIIGLALGIACCLLIALYIKDELSYDQQHPNVERLYRVYRDINLTNFVGENAAIPSALPVALVNEVPEITKSALLNPYFGNAGTNLVRKITAQQNRFEEGFVYANQGIFELFNLPLIEGEITTILTVPNTIVISEKMAKKYFPSQSPIGETLVLNDDTENQSFKITGVMENMPTQMHFNYDFFISMPTLSDSEQIQWLSNNYYGYITLKEGTDLAQLNQKLDNFSDKTFAPAFKNRQIELFDKSKTGQYYRVRLQPVQDIHLHSVNFTPQLAENGDIRYVHLFAIIAFFIFVIALVNFVNLSTARSANRAKEVGVRKVLGAMKEQLISQFLIESVLMSIIAFIMGSFFAVWLLPFFNDLSGKNLSMPYTDWTFFPVFLIAAIGAGLLAGLYPSFYLSAFEPIKVLKGKLSKGSKSGWLRSSLVVGQFAISIGLIVATMVVYQQMNFIQHIKLGYDKDQVLLIQDTYTLGDKLPSFKSALKTIPAVKNATMSSYLPFEGGNRNSVAFSMPGQETDPIPMQMWRVDEDYMNTLGMKLAAGRNFESNMATDSLAVILNEKAVQTMGLIDPIGKQIKSPFFDDAYTVIGIVEDFNFESLKGKIESLGLFLATSNAVIAVKANGSAVDNLITKTEALWNDFAPMQPFRYTFLDDEFANMYVAENRVGKLFNAFAILAIFIACLGLFAMATFMTEQRTKEIGIRKVLGASTFNIVLQLSKNFLYLVLLGLLIATPIAYFQMEEWLSHFEYRIDIAWWIFVVSGLLVLIIAFLTVGGQSLRAALVNPIDSLKAE